MTDKELKHMSRAELLEMLIDKSRQNEELKAQLEDTVQQLNDCALNGQKAGTMAEAAPLVNGVLDAAQQAAQQYLEHVAERLRMMEESCMKIETESRAQAARLLADAQDQCRKMEQETQQRCAQLYRTAEQEANRNWDDLFARLEQLQSENGQIRQMLEEREKKRKWGL